MANSKHASGNGYVAKIIAIVLAILLVVGGVFSVGYSLGWFTQDETNQTILGGGATISIGESNGIKLTSATVKAGTGTAESTQTLSATVTPGYATDPTLSWSIAWDTTWEGYESAEDVNHESWGTSSDDLSTVDISDYVSLSATSGSEITVSCWQPFGCPIIITVETTDGTNLSATCKVDYQSFYKGVSVTDLSNVTMSASVDGVKSVYITGDYTTGTIAASGSLTYSVETNADLLIHTADTYEDDLNCITDTWNYSVSGATSTLSGDGQITVLKFSLNWTTFVQELIDGNDYIIGNDSDCSYSEYNEYALNDYYALINYIGLDDFHPFTINVSLTDTKTGATYTDSTVMSFASLSGYPVTSATSLNISNSNMVF